MKINEKMSVGISVSIERFVVTGIDLSIFWVDRDQLVV